MVARLGLMGLALLFSLVNFFLGTAEGVLTPMILSFINFAIAYLIGGPLADKVFEPLMADGGTLAGSLGRLIGIGRGMGLMFAVMGLLASAAAVSVLAYPRIRNVETELPDAVQ